MSDPTDAELGDPSAMGETAPLPPLREFKATLFYKMTVPARSVQDAHDIARNRWGDWFTGNIEAK